MCASRRRSDVTMIRTEKGHVREEFRCAVWLRSTLAMASPLAAQDDEGFAERERALARELAEQQERSASERASAARAQSAGAQQQQRELSARYRRSRRELSRASRRRGARVRGATARARNSRTCAAAHARARERAVESEIAAARLGDGDRAAVGAALAPRCDAENVQDSQRLHACSVRAACSGSTSRTRDGGVRVKGVTPNGPAAAPAWHVGDTIVAINGFELDERRAARSPTAALLGQLADVEPGRGCRATDPARRRCRESSSSRRRERLAPVSVRAVYRDGFVTLLRRRTAALPRPRRRSSSTGQLLLSCSAGPGTTSSSCR